MPTGVISWSKTAATNASADSAVNFAEGQAPSSVNDSARALMGSVAKWRDDLCGSPNTGGTGTAYTLTSNQTIASNIDGFTIQFVPGTTNTGAVTLSVDGQTAKPLRFRTGVDLPAGVLISGSLYQTTYRSGSDEWLLHSFDASIYAIPIGGSINYWAATAPNGAFVIPAGQAISRTTYATLFALISTTYGSGDGSTTFNLPNPAGRNVVQRESSASLLTSTYFGGNSTVLGAVGGTESHTLTAAQIPSITSENASQAISVTSNTGDFIRGFVSSMPDAGGVAGRVGNPTVNTVTSTGANSISVTSNNTNGNAHNNVPPTIIANQLMRII